MTGRTPGPGRVAAVGLALVVGLALGGCGFGDAMVGIHDAPTENVTGAAIGQDTAQEIATRVLDDARAASSATGSDAAAAQKAVLSGAALAVARAATATHSVDDGDVAPLTTPDAPKILAVSQGKEWPRAILAATLDEAQSKQYLDVLVSQSATSPYTLAATVPMHGGRSIPALGEFADGAPLVAPDDGSGMVASPQDVLAQYAAALTYPKPAKAAAVATDDPFADLLMANAKAQARSLGKLGKLTVTQQVIEGDTISFRLADGGAVTFGLLKRTDKIVLGKKAKELRLPSTYATLSGKKTVKERLTVVSLEPVVLVVPTSGKANAVGGHEQIVSARGR